MEIRTFTLANGLTIVGERQAWQPGVAFELALMAGAVNETVEGASAVLEEWIYRGAGGLSSRQLADKFDDLGLQKTGGTSVEMMTFGGAVLAEDLLKALPLFAQLVKAPNFDESEFAACRDLAWQELEGLKDQPLSWLFSQLRHRFFLTPHGRSPLGSFAGLKSLTPELLREDFHQRFGPEGSILALSGGFAWADLEKAVELFADWSGSTIKAAKPQTKGHFYEHIQEKTAQEQICVVYPDLSVTDSQIYHSKLGLEVLSGGFSTRLMQEIREKRGLVYSVGAIQQNFKGISVTVGYGGTTPQRSQETLDVLIAEFERLSHGVSEEEIKRAKIGLLSGLVMNAESCLARVRGLVRDIYLLGRARSLDEIRKSIQEITLDELNEFLAGHSYQNPAVMTLGEKELMTNYGK